MRETSASATPHNRFGGVHSVQIAARKMPVGRQTDFLAGTGTPLAQENVRERVLQPLLERLGLPKAGLHAFRHSRVTQLRKAGTPQDLQKQWIGHSSLRTGDRYSHTHEEVEYRGSPAGNVGLDRVLSPQAVPT